MLFIEYNIFRRKDENILYSQKTPLALFRELKSYNKSWISITCFFAFGSGSLEQGLTVYGVWAGFGPWSYWCLVEGVLGDIWWHGLCLCHAEAGWLGNQAAENLPVQWRGGVVAAASVL